MYGNHLLAFLDYPYNTTSSCDYNNVFYYNDGVSTASSGSDPDTLKVWLCHHSIGSLSDYYTTYGYQYYYPYIYYYGYDLTTALTAAAQQSSKSSVVVDLKARIASGNTVGWQDFCCKTTIH